MTNPELERLDRMTRDYAEFQARKAGLGTALGGLMALVMTLFVAIQPLLHAVGRVVDWRTVVTVIFLMPLLWLPLKSLLAGLLYGDLGAVRPLPDASYERQKWRWVFGLGLFLLAFQTLALLGFANGLLNFVRHPESLGRIPGSLALKWQPWLWVGGLPLLYLAAAPWGMKGREEARAYAVLVAEGIIWTAYGFSMEGVNVSGSTKGWMLWVFFGIQLGVLVWAGMAIRRGWREHLEYAALLRGLPGEDKA